MNLLLNIETSTTACSVSLSSNGALLDAREVDNGYTHSENLHVFMDELLKANGVAPSQLSAIAVSRGPGSYTGLRIGVSAAKGLAYALRLPLLSVDTLQVMAAAVKEKMRSATFYCPLIDARRMEVYTAIYDNALAQVSSTEALILDEAGIKKITAFNNICYFGNGMPKGRELLSAHTGAHFIDAVAPSAKHMCALSHQKFITKLFEDVAYFEPLYLKDFMLLKKNQP